MRFADSPTTESEIHVDAAPDVVWALVTDVDLPARFSDEFQGAQWLDPDAEPSIGSQFRGHNRNPGIGEWEVTCTVTEWAPSAAFTWTVGDLDAPVAVWQFTLTPDGTGTRLRQWARMGPGPSGVTSAIERDPENEEKIVGGRLRQWQRNMDATIAGIKALAEAAGLPDNA